MVVALAGSVVGASTAQPHGLKLAPAHGSVLPIDISQATVNSISSSYHVCGEFQNNRSSALKEALISFAFLDSAQRVVVRNIMSWTSESASMSLGAPKQIVCADAAASPSIVGVVIAPIRVNFSDGTAWAYNTSTPPTERYEIEKLFAIASDTGTTRIAMDSDLSVSKNVTPEPPRAPCEDLIWHEMTPDKQFPGVHDAEYVSTVRWHEEIFWGPVGECYTKRSDLKRARDSYLQCRLASMILSATRSIAANFIALTTFISGTPQSCLRMHAICTTLGPTSTSRTVY